MVIRGARGTDALRSQIRERGALANIAPKVNRKEKACFSPFLYRDRNAVEHSEFPRRLPCRHRQLLIMSPTLQSPTNGHSARTWIE
jgi:hypothetical protein